ncbi:thiol-disulfide oxidoreductase ResA [mine drainage metagenome]|uniref:Thiol-disulfide oxidoreductase ResA n=1 Tax=mine drainage metagenome TaxID=410659 RepID=A0A1J5RSV3_9ZZZZ
MKKFLFALMLPLSVAAQDGYTIKGNIKGLKDSTLVFLTSGADGSMLSQDYAFNGQFNLKGKLESADIYQLNFIGKKETVDMFIGNENIVVTGEASKLKSAAVAGSKLNGDYNYYVQGFTPLKEKLGAIVPKINSEKEGKKRDSLIKQYQSYINQVLQQVNKFVKEKPASQVSPFVLYVVNPLFPNVDVLEEKYDHLQPAAKKGIYAKLIEELVAKTKVGNEGSMAIDFTQNDTANHPVSLSSFKGKYVLLDFWASWCGPCRRENPNVVAAFNAYKDKGFTILSVSLDQNKANWLQAIADDNLTWTHVSDLKYWSNAVAQLYHIESIPQNFLIDPSGKIIGKNLRGEDLKVRLKELLK